jgi:hypothetical protein
MKLYEIIVANYLDDTNHSVLVLSEEPLCKNNININAIAGIERDNEHYYVSKVQEPIIKANIWDVSDIEKCEQMQNIIDNNIYFR